MGKKITVKGNNIVVGKHNSVNQQISKGLSSKDFKTLSETFLLLRQDIAELEMSDKSKKRAIRAIDEVEDEATDSSPDGKTIHDSLKRFKEILEDAGIIYDKAKGWGNRLFGLGQLLLPYAPALSDLIN